MNEIASKIPITTSALHMRVTSAEQLEQQKEAERIEQKSGLAPGKDPAKLNVDEYIPGEAPNSAGIYQLTKDAEGNPKIIFDAPAAQPEKAGSDKTEGEKCTANTDKVDAEIKQLKKKKEQIEQEMAHAKDNPEKQEKLEKQLQQMEHELSSKDNDTYRRQHSQFTNSNEC